MTPPGDPRSAEIVECVLLDRDRGMECEECTIRDHVNGMYLLDQQQQQQEEESRSKSSYKDSERAICCEHTGGSKYTSETKRLPTHWPESEACIEWERAARNKDLARGRSQ